MLYFVRRRAPLLCAIAFCLFSVAGCSSAKSGGGNSGEDINSAMTAEQKAAIAEHKRKADQ